MSVVQDEVIQEQWVPITQAWKMLGITHTKFYRRLEKYQFEVRLSKNDERLRYVNLVEIRRILEL